MGYVVSFPNTDTGWGKAQDFIDIQSARKATLPVGEYNRMMDGDEDYDSRTPRQVLGDKKKALLQYTGFLSVNIRSCIKEIRDIKRRLEIIPGIIEKQEERVRQIESEIEELPKFSPELRVAEKSKKQAENAIENMHMKIGSSATLDIKHLWNNISRDRAEKCRVSRF